MHCFVLHSTCISIVCGAILCCRTTILYLYFLSHRLIENRTALINGERTIEVLGNCYSMAAASTTDSIAREVRWMYTTKDMNAQPCDWGNFQDVENIIIEEAYQANQTHADIDWCYIDFSLMVCISNYSNRDHRPVKRVIRDSEGHFATRGASDISNSTNANDASTVNRPGAFGEFIWEAYLLGQWRDVSQDVLVEKAAQGIIKEGKLYDKPKQAEWMAKHLLEVKNGTRKQIWHRCVYLYTLESFLYLFLNRILRMVNSGVHEQIWKSTLETLGLFAWFLFDFPQDADPFEGYVYKGVCLEPKGINSLETSAKIGELLAFPTFTSTSRNQSVAEKYGNALVIISIVRSRETSVDVSTVSHYPWEEEQLLIPGFLFKITHVEFDAVKEKHLIYLQDCNNQQEI